MRPDPDPIQRRLGKEGSHIVADGHRHSALSTGRGHMDNKTEKKEIGIKCKTGGSTGDPGGHGERGLAQLCLSFNLQKPSLAWSHILWLPPTSLSLPCSLTHCSSGQL